MPEVVSTLGRPPGFTAEILEQARRIRTEVFVHEQGVPAAEEFDEHDLTVPHYLAVSDGTPCGAARRRVTENGVKLERFAVLKSYRSQGVGSALLERVLAEIEADPALKHKTRYLHAQVTAMPLYAKFGFEAVGPLFLECDIEHYKMVQKS